MRFRIRTLLTAVLIAGLIMGLIAQEVRFTMRERRLLVELERALAQERLERATLARQHRVLARARQAAATQQAQGDVAKP